MLFLDTEFNGVGGKLISLALVPAIAPEHRALYVKLPALDDYDPWVAERVLPIIDSAPCQCIAVDWEELPLALNEYLAGMTHPHFVADWPIDLVYLSEAMITGPGTMIDVQRFTCEVFRCEPYPSEREGAIQHNAWWDALCLNDCYFAETGLRTTLVG